MGLDAGPACPPGRVASARDVRQIGQPLRRGCWLYPVSWFPRTFMPASENYVVAALDQVLRELGALTHGPGVRPLFEALVQAAADAVGAQGALWCWEELGTPRVVATGIAHVEGAAQLF